MTVTEHLADFAEFLGPDFVETVEIGHVPEPGLLELLDIAIEFFGVPTLAHTAKNATDVEGVHAPFGSVFQQPDVRGVAGIEVIDVEAMIENEVLVAFLHLRVPPFLVKPADRPTVVGEGVAEVGAVVEGEVPDLDVEIENDRLAAVGG